MVSCSPTPVPRVGGVRVWGVRVWVWGCGYGGRGVLPYGVVGPAVE